MECTVESRMETGDHWVLYATVDDGELMVCMHVNSWK
jgi:flavin reductase (DIM6/NTAB) family NADH-FMN oxidoreductase RutF